MELSDSRKIAADRETVFAALNDPEVLRQAIPGCERLEKESDEKLSATVALKVGPVKARFEGEVELSDLNPPESYVISGSGKGGAAGFASGSARVRLTEQDGGTLLEYSVDAKVGGKIAQLGSRLIDATARKLAGEFFDKFGALVEGGPAAESAPAAEGAQAASGKGVPKWAWAAVALAVALAIAAIYSV